MTLKSYLLALLVIIVWGSNFAVIKIGAEAFEPLMLLASRFFLAGLIFLPFVKWPGWKKAIQISSIGLFMGLLHQGFLYVGIKYIPAGTMSIILQSNVIMVTLIGWLFLKETIGWRTWAGIAIAFVGIFILVDTSSSNANMLGYIYGFLSAFFIAFAYLIMKKIDKVPAATYMVFLHLPIAPFIFLSSLIFEGTSWITNASSLNWPIIISAIVYQAVILSSSHIVWQRLLVQHPVSQLVPLTLAIPVFAVITAILLLGETITPSIIFGGSLTIAGVGLITFRKIKKNMITPAQAALE